MINIEKLREVVEAINALDKELETTLRIEHTGDMSVSIMPIQWWDGKRLTEEQRHVALALLTPLVGKMTKEVNETDIGYVGEADGLKINLSRVDSCKIVGYKKVTRQVAKVEMKMIEKREEVETGEFEDKEDLIPITDCEIRMGRASESDIEVPA